MSARHDPQTASPAQPQPRSGDAASTQLACYLDAFEARGRRLIWLRGAAAAAAVALVLTWLGAWLAIRTGYAPGALDAARALLLAALALCAVIGVALPLRRLRGARARKLEALAPEFDGRLQTHAGLAEEHPFRTLLAEDALAVARRHAPSSLISASRLRLAALALALPALALLWLSAAGPGLYRDAARALWGGWLSGSLLPAERIAVAPGDQLVRQGASITVHSVPQGFDPAQVQLHARVGGGPWQQLEMARAVQGFAFTFFSMRAPVSYYVSAAGVRSPAYRLSVVQVPAIERLRLVYRYPRWTHLPERVQEGSGDIAAIEGTQVQLQLHASSALPLAELVLDGTATRMSGAGQDAQAQLTVTRDARYYLATRIGGERVRLSEDFLIRRLPVPAPSVRVSWPGHDYSASSIEEVTTDVEASDDYGLQSLQLRYSVNGGVWRAVSLPLPSRGTRISAQQVFALESLRTDGPGRALAPGDLISYYAVAQGHAQSAQSDLYFIDVQPFDRRYSQSQAAGTGSDDSDEQQQISDRQRQILLSTWNLLRTQEAGGVRSASLRDNAALLATLQRQLAAQAQALAGRTQARELSQDERIARFIDSMRRAAAAMQPAAQHLAATDLGAAVAPEQQALQYLLQAQAQFTDLQVSLGRGGSATQSDRDMSQIYQLEMDLHKNQYESGDGASPDVPDAGSEALARRLQQLAQRQQQLADELQRRGVPTPEQRWRQQSLQREAEQLQRELQAAGFPGAGAQAGGTQGAGSAAGDATRDAGNAAAGTAGAAGTASPAGPQAGGTLAGAGALAQRLQAAISAMGEAAQALGGAGAGRQAGAGATVRADAPAAARRAGQALGEASAALARERAQALQAAVSRLAQRAAELHDQQAASAQALQSTDAGDALGQRALADQKRALSSGVRRLDDAISAAAQAHRRDAPATSAALTRARAPIRAGDLGNRLDIAAQALDQGAGRSVQGEEAQITQGLAELQRRLQAAALIAGADERSAAAMPDALEQELARVRALRSQLAQAADAAQAAGASPAPAAAARQSAAAAAAVAAGALRLEPQLHAQGADAAELASIQQLARTLGQTPAPPAGREPDLQRLRAEVDVLDALELALERRAALAAEPARAAVSGRGAEQYQSAVAEYYRQLSRQ